MKDSLKQPQPADAIKSITEHLLRAPPVRVLRPVGGDDEAHRETYPTPRRLVPQEHEADDDDDTRNC